MFIKVAKKIIPVLMVASAAAFMSCESDGGKTAENQTITFNEDQIVTQGTDFDPMLMNDLMNTNLMDSEIMDIDQAEASEEVTEATPVDEEAVTDDSNYENM